MVNYSETQLDSVFSALADPTRRAILAQLMHGDAATTGIKTPRKMSLPGLMKHLGVLERAGLIRKQKRGRVAHCQLAAEPMVQAVSWLGEYQRFWGQQLDSLADYLEQQKIGGEEA